MVTPFLDGRAASPNAIQACCGNDRLNELKGLTAELDRTQKSLTDYLDTKRESAEGSRRDDSSNWCCVGLIVLVRRLVPAVLLHIRR